MLGAIDNIKLMEPLDYEPFVYLMSKSRFIMTDSGGIQEEAPSFGTPVLVMRELTERMEAVNAGVARLVGTRRSNIMTVAERLLTDDKEIKKMRKGRNPFGDGRASERIVKGISKYFRKARG
jgi:UDP-N-acetylglucosamine 2-epimerase (non-hydrolysing)